MVTLKLTETKTLEVNNKLVEKITREAEVCKNEGKEEYRKSVENYAIYFCPKDKNSGVPDLNWANRSWDKWDDNTNVLKKRLSLFWDLIKNNHNKLLCQQ